MCRSEGGEKWLRYGPRMAEQATTNNDQRATNNVGIDLDAPITGGIGPHGPQGSPGGGRGPMGGIPWLGQQPQPAAQPCSHARGDSADIDTHTYTHTRMLGTSTVSPPFERPEGTAAGA